MPVANMDTTANMAPVVTHVAAFVRILNASQTQELHQWTLPSLERAFAWASAMESLTEKAENDGEEATATLDAALAQHLRHAALPTMAHGEVLSVKHTLRNATRIACDAVLTSAWLLTHPARAEFTAHVMKTRLRLATLGADRDGALSELFMAQVHAQRSLEAAHKMSDVVVHGMKKKRVLVCSAAFDVPPVTSYTLQRRTQRLQSLARTLQANVCAAHCLSSRVEAAAYHAMLTGIDGQLQQAQCDVVEVIVWSVVLEWPSSAGDISTVVRRDVVQRIERWAETLSMKALLVSLAPWLAAMLARVSAVFARHYVAGLFPSGCLHTLDTEDLRSRIGALVLQNDAGELHTLVDAQLAALDPLTREQLLASLSI